MIRECSGRFVAALAFAFLAANWTAHATTYKVLHRFKDPQLGYPTTGVTADGAGNLYGTLNGNGSGAPGKHCSKSCGGGVYSILATGQTKILYKFHLKTGSRPAAPLLFYHDHFYGTTGDGGSGSGCFAGQGCGVVFRLSTTGREKVLYNFCIQPNCADGFDPSGLVADAVGNLYGETAFGGPNTGAGDVFKLSPDGTYIVLHAFCSEANCIDGYAPDGGLILDRSGNLYGTTPVGGTGSGCGNPTGCGTVFKLAPDGTETVLYNFCTKSNCADGGVPGGGVMQDSEGNFFGTTITGGSGSCNIYGPGCGTVFKLTLGGRESLIYSFQGGVDGDTPTAGLVQDASGNLYGTTEDGGGGTDEFCAYPMCGTVFKIAPHGQETILHAFCSELGCSDGGDPATVTPVLENNFLYGTTWRGGYSEYGTVWKVRK